MKNPFKSGDRVYHPSHESALIICETEDDLARFKEEDKPYISGWVNCRSLSFKPWPAPCHKRPIEDGWWVCTGSRNDEPYIREVRQGKVRYIGREFNLEQYTLHRYLGKDWK